MDFGMDSLFVRWIMASDLISTSFFFGDFFGVFFCVFFCVFSIDTKGISITGMPFSYQVDIIFFFIHLMHPRAFGVLLQRQSSEMAIH